MKLQEYLDKKQIELCKSIGLDVKNTEYTIEEIFNMEHAIVDYISENCMNEEFYEKEEELDNIVDILMDLENETDETNDLIVEIYEDDHVELSNGKQGIVVDITNNVYTVEVDKEFRTGNLEEDIMIVATNSISRKI